MKRAQVWLDKIRVTREKRQGAGSEYEVRCMHLPAEKLFLGECEATPEAVAKLSGVHVYYATIAMERMGTGCFVFSTNLGTESIEYYLVVLPAGEKRQELI
jgi:hypothetical protein